MALVVGGILLTAAVVAGLLYMKMAPSAQEGVVTLTKKSQKGPLAAYATGSLSKLVTYETPAAPQDFIFQDGAGKTLHLKDLKGQVTVVNLWATWCGPCKTEMPTLAELSKTYGPKGVKVVAISVDPDSRLEDVKSFIGVHDPLEVYHDGEMKGPQALGFPGLPGTVILDKEGRMVASLAGEADWSSKEARALMDAVTK